MNGFLKTLSLGILASLILMGCRGQTSQEPPLLIRHGMEYQGRFMAYQNNKFYADGRAMRQPPEGTVAQGLLKADDNYYRGGTDTSFLAKSPVPLTAALLERGQQRYNIYCAPCHGQTGIGDGMVVKKGFLPPPNFHDERIVTMRDGQLFRTISNGIRNMPAYGNQIPEDDRWAVVAYLRALQRSQLGSLNDVPDSERNKLK